MHAWYGLNCTQVTEGMVITHRHRMLGQGFTRGPVVKGCVSIRGNEVCVGGDGERAMVQASVAKWVWVTVASL